MKKVTMIFLLTQIFAFVVVAQKPVILMDDEPGWKKIGETTVNFEEENESILVYGKDQFSTIRLEVEDAPVKFERLQVFYESGQMKDFDIKDQIGVGEQSKDFRLDATKEISKVAFTYQTQPNREGTKANVVLYGLVVKNSDAYRDQDIVDKISEETTKRIAELSDRRHENKVGPNGQIVYIEEREPRYYYVDRQGQKVYVSEAALKEKDDN